MDRHQAIALVLLVATLFALLLDTTRAVSVLETVGPSAVPVQQQVAPEPQPVHPVWDPAQDGTPRFVAQAEPVAA